VQNIALACCVLHNYIKCKEGKHYLKGIEVEDTDAAALIEGEWRKSANEPIEIRKNFTTYFNTTGFVSWQWEAIKKFNF
jgi:hypothetical protein